MQIDEKSQLIPLAISVTKAIGWPTQRSWNFIATKIGAGGTMQASMATAIMLQWLGISPPASWGWARWWGSYPYTGIFPHWTRLLQWLGWFGHTVPWMTFPVGQFKWWKPLQTLPPLRPHHWRLGCENRHCRRRVCRWRSHKNPEAVPWSSPWEQQLSHDAGLMPPSMPCSGWSPRLLADVQPAPHSQWYCRHEDAHPRVDRAFWPEPHGQGHTGIWFWFAMCSLFTSVAFCLVSCLVWGSFMVMFDEPSSSRTNIEEK